MVGVEFARDGMGADGEGIGTMFLFMDDRIVANGIFRTMTGRHSLRGDGPSVGRDGNHAAATMAPASTLRAGGSSRSSATVADGQYRDIEREMAMALAGD